MPKPFGEIVAKAKAAVTEAGRKRGKPTADWPKSPLPSARLPDQARVKETTVNTRPKDNGPLGLDGLKQEGDVEAGSGSSSSGDGSPSMALVEQKVEAERAETDLIVERTASMGGLRQRVPQSLKGKERANATYDFVEETSATNSSPAASSNVTEQFGLFPFPPRKEHNETTSTPAPDFQKQHVDIIVIHGVGGHWIKTWQAPDGAIWLRDRIPSLFRDTNISCRVRSFGYNSASFFTRGGIDVRDCAKDLIDRIRVLRRKDLDESRPIIFIAHSLGGLVVKEALNRAWTRQALYGDILTAIKGCIFLGVPHHGAAIASWAKHATQITKLLTLGFAGNTSFLGTLEPDSREWIRISGDFVDRGKNLSFYTFYETQKLGNLMVVDKASAIMHLPNEQCFAIQGSDHRAIARFGYSDNERFSLVGDAIYNLVNGSFECKQHASQTLIFDLPPATCHVHGTVSARHYITHEFFAVRQLRIWHPFGRFGSVVGL